MSGRALSRVFTITRPVSLKGPMHTLNFMCSLTVLERGNDLLVFDTGLDADEGLAGAFHSVGLDPGRVSHVFLTHIHIDHFGGNPLFPRARKVVSRKELEYQRKWNDEFMGSSDRRGYLASCFPHLSSWEAARLADVIAAGHEKYFKEEILGDSRSFTYLEDDPELPERIRPIATPGHTPHHCSFEISGSRRAAIVTGDLFPGRRSFYGENNGFVEVYSNRDEAARSLDVVRQVGARRETVLCPAHDRPFGFADGAYLRRSTWTLGE